MPARITSTIQSIAICSLKTPAIAPNKYITSAADVALTTSLATSFQYAAENIHGRGGRTLLSVFFNSAIILLHAVRDYQKIIVLYPDFSLNQMISRVLTAVR